jgi:hypothetical protein
MWNELLLALSGNAGDVFVVQPDGKGLKVTALPEELNTQQHTTLFLSLGLSDHLMH